MKRNEYINKTMDFVLSYLTRDPIFTASIGSYKLGQTEIMSRLKIPEVARLVVSKKGDLYEVRLVYGDRDVVAAISDVKECDRIGVADRELRVFNGFRSYEEETFEWVFAKEQIPLGIIRPLGFKVFSLRQNQCEFFLENGTLLVGNMKNCVSREILALHELEKEDAPPAYFWPVMLIPAHEKGTELYKKDVKLFHEYIIGCKKFIKEVTSEAR